MISEQIRNARCKMESVRRDAIKEAQEAEERRDGRKRAYNIGLREGVELALERFPRD